MTAYRLAPGGRIDRPRPCASPSTAALSRALPATRWPRRCWPTACTWSAAPSSTTGRAASVGRRGGAERAGRASTAAPGRRAEPARDAGRALRRAGRREPEPLAVRCGFDIGAVNDLAVAAVPAGFYYKTFMWPRGFWHRFYEPCIRRAAGLGRAPDAADPDRYAQPLRPLRVLVVGAGPAGLAAALAAAASGARVILCDEQAEIGGSLLLEPTRDDRRRAGVRTGSPRRWPSLRAHAGRHAAAAHDGLRLLRPQPRRPGRAADRPLGAADADAAARAAVAGAREAGGAGTGAIERPLVFPDNDRPGVMLADAARDLSAPLRRRGRASAPWSSPRNDSAYARRPRPACGRRRRSPRSSTCAPRRRRRCVAGGRAQPGIEVLTGHAVLGTRGRLRVTGVTSAPCADGTARCDRRTIACDLLLMSGGWTPTVHLFSQSRGKLRCDAAAAGLRARPHRRRRSARRAPAAASTGIGAALDGWLAAGAAAAGDRARRRGAP